MPPRKTAKPVQNYARSGWGLIILGMSTQTIYAVLNALLHKANIVGAGDKVVTTYEVNISGYAFGVPSIMILCGIVLIMHGPLGQLIEKWRGKK